MRHAKLFLKLIDATLPINSKEKLEVYKDLIELLQKRINETAKDAQIPINEPSDDYYERHESPKIVAAYLKRLKSALVVPSSYSIYTEEERDLF